MEKIREQVNRLLEECKKENVAIMVAYGSEKTCLGEWGTLTDKTPDRIKRARAAFINAPSQTRGIMEFDA